MKKTLKQNSNNRTPAHVTKRLKREKLLSKKYPTARFNTSIRRTRIKKYPYLYTAKKSAGGRRRRKKRQTKKRRKKKKKRRR
jgi:hypothetical protein